METLTLSTGIKNYLNSNKMKKESFYLKEEAEDMARMYAEDIDGIIEHGSCDCDSFPVPDGVDTWSGETGCVRVYDENGDLYYAAAYWE